MGLSASAIIVNWNGDKWLPECLATLREQEAGLREIIVVDNGSSDGSRSVARAHGARWISMRRNIGLAPALNAGARAATGEALLFLNNDMRFDRRFVGCLLAPLSDPGVFASDALQYDWEGRRVVHWACRLEDAAAGETSHRPFYGAWINQYRVRHVVDVALASAAAMMVRREMFEQIGGFDDLLPINYEDLDICLRAWSRGWRTVFTPHAVCWHHVSASSESRAGHAAIVRGIVIGRLRCALKFATVRGIALTWIPIPVGDGGPSASEIRRLFGTGPRALCSGGAYAMRTLPVTLRQRAALASRPWDRLPFPPSGEYESGQKD